MLVADTRMVNIMDTTGKYGLEYFKWCDHLLKVIGAQQDVGCLGHISNIEVVVVRNIF